MPETPNESAGTDGSDRRAMREDRAAAKEDRDAAREDRAAAREDRAAAREERAAARRGGNDAGSSKREQKTSGREGSDSDDQDSDEQGSEDSAAAGARDTDRNPDSGRDSKRDDDDNQDDDKDHKKSASKDDDKKDSDGADNHKSLLHRPVVLVTGGAILLVIVVGVLIWWWHASGFENTDDAFIDARIVRVAPRISGQVNKVLVDDNQLVHAGDAIVDIDPADARSSLDQAIAQQSQAETALTQSRADVVVAEAQRKQAAATAAGAEAQALNASQDLKRYLDLKASTPQAVAQGQIDQAVAAARNTAAQRNAAAQQVKSAEAQIVAANAAVAGAQARVETSRAQQRQSQLNLGYTRVIAPVDGHIAKRTVAVGSYVSPGQQILAIVPLEMWVTGNFKEIQLERIRPNQEVSVHVDGCPAADLRGHVDSIQRGAGQAFALLPAENATGNYVKVVQRVPVKIILDEVPRDCPIGPGMSVQPKIRVR